MPPKKNINMKEEDSTIKKRGRPPKTKSSSKHNKLKDYNDDINDDKILYITDMLRNNRKKLIAIYFFNDTYKIKSLKTYS